MATHFSILAWRATVQGVTKSQTQLSDQAYQGLVSASYTHTHTHTHTHTRVHGHLQKPIRVLHSRAVVWVFTGTDKRHLLSKKPLNSLARASRGTGGQSRVKKPGVIVNASQPWWGTHAEQPAGVPIGAGVCRQNTSLRRVSLNSPVSLVSKHQVRLELGEQERSCPLDLTLKFRFRLKYLGVLTQRTSLSRSVGPVGGDG